MIWQVVTSDGDMRFYVDKVEAEFAVSEAVKRGMSARMSPISMPRSPGQLADLLQMCCDDERGQ
jgi:hypothetical protein